MAAKIKVDQIETVDATDSITINNTVVMASGKTLPAASLTGTLPAISGANLTNLPAANLTGTLPAISGANLTNLPADATKLPLAGGTMTGNISHAGDLTLDVGGDISLDADGGDILLKDAGTTFGTLSNDAGYFDIKSTVSNQDISFKGNDGGSAITALRLDMSEGGRAVFNNGVAVGGTGAANTLDDYEEGTWTPTAIGGLSGLTATDCHYRKIGSLVHIAGRVNAFTGINTATLQFGGLPFNPTHSTSSGTVSTTFVDLDQGYQLWMALSHDWDRIYIRYQMNNAQYNSLTGSDISSSSNIHFNATYIVD